MAKIVIAGISDCPYFARVELLGDHMMKTLPAFHLHKIVKTPGEWTSWLRETCKEYGWTHETSPLIWRELLDRGGKPSLIGGTNAFQEYVKGYYDRESSLTTDEMMTIRMENFHWKQEVEIEEAYYRELSKPLYVCITAAESPVCYTLVAALLGGEVFEKKTAVYLRLLTSDPREAKVVRATAMEAMDLCSQQMRGVEVVESTVEAFKNCSLIILLDELPRDVSTSEDVNSWLFRNYLHFSALGRQINHLALKHVRVLLAGTGPVNFNTMVVIQSAPEIFRHNVVGLTREVEGRAIAVIARRLKVSTSQIGDIIVWGSINGQRYIDTSQAKVFAPGGSISGPSFYWESVEERLGDRKWLEREFLPSVEQRPVEVEKALGHSAFASTATAVIWTLNYLVNGSSAGRIFSLAVCSEGWYDVPDGLVFSFPVIFSPKGNWTVVQDMQLTRKMEMTFLNIIKDLILEVGVVYPAFYDYLRLIEQEKKKLKGVLATPDTDVQSSSLSDDTAVAKSSKEGKLENVKFSLSSSKLHTVSATSQSILHEEPEPDL